jgi:hypothetical protein
MEKVAGGIFSRPVIMLRSHSLPYFPNVLFYKFDNSVMIFGVFVAYASALHNLHFG